MSLLEILQDMLPDSWFNDVRANYGSTLTDDMISQSVQQASEFFNIDNPMAIGEDWTTGVYNNSPLSPMDDILVFNREQLIGMGITEQEGLDLVMTHEGAHRALQGMNMGFNSHQEELCCDFMAGVRAGLNGIDVSQMENSLVDTPVSETHPAGHDRVDAIEDGAKFAVDYYNAHGVAPTFSDCLDYFKGEADIADLGKDAHINLRPESYTAAFSGYTDVDAAIDRADAIIHEVETELGISDDNELKGYTQSEINSRISKAERDMGYWKAEVRRHGELAEHEMWRESEISHMKSAERKYDAAKAEYNKWKGMKPDKTY